MTTWTLQGYCPKCERPVPFECSRKEHTTGSGHRILGRLVIVCPQGHCFVGPEAEAVLHGARSQIEDGLTPPA